MQIGDSSALDDLSVIEPAFREGAGLVVYRLARGTALLGGLLLFGLALMLVVTIISRKLFYWQIYGDYELVQMFGALAGSLMFPWCALVRGDVMVELATAALPAGVIALLDRLGSFLLAAMLLLVTWRTGALALGSYSSGSISPMLSWPVWAWQALMLPGLGLAGVISLCRAFMRGVPVALARDAA